MRCYPARLSRSARVTPWFLALALFAACTKPPQTSSLLLSELEAKWTPEVAASQPASKFFEPVVGAINPNTGYVTMRNKTGGLDVRMALVLDSGSEGVWRVQIPSHERPQLKMALGWDLDAQESVARQRYRARNEIPSPTVSYSLLLKTQGQLHPLIRETRDATHNGTWQEMTVDLSSWRGELVELVFSSSSEAATRAAWGNPELSTGAYGNPQQPNLILISLDTLRADRMGAYGYQQETTPNLDRFAQGAHVFSDVTAQSTWTRPSHWSMLSGLYPESYAGFTHRPLAQLLQQSGYRTEAWTAGVQLHPKFGFHHGFQAFQVYDWIAKPQTLLDGLDDRSRPFFLFLHTYEAHDPYDHPEFLPEPAAENSRVDQRFGNHLHQRLEPLSRDERHRASELYDANIRFLDQQMGILLDGMRQSNLLDNTVVVITSDHGEEFWEHGIWFHGRSFHRATIAVPLIVEFPSSLVRIAEIKVPPGVVATPVRLLDLYPTLLDVLGIENQHRVQGRSLLPLLQGGALPEVPIYSEGLFHTSEVGRSIRDGQYKLTWQHDPEYLDLDDPRAAPRIQLFDLVEDPWENHNLVTERPEVVERLRGLMETIAAGRVETDSTADENLGPEHQAELRALGYL